MYTIKQIEEVCKLKKAGMTHRDIAYAVFGKRSMASSVFYILYNHMYTKPEPLQGPRVLVLDIETSPETAYVWGRFKQFVAPVQVVERSYMLTWAAKWLGEGGYESVIVDAIPYHYETDSHDDYAITRSMWNLLDECDVAIAHNGAKFDFAYLNSRFIFHGLGMPSPYKVVDTLRIAKKYFRFPSNSLKELGIYLGIETPKLDTDFSLWIGCMKGDMESWEKMVEYNKYDVLLLEELYKRIRHYDKQAPNFALYFDDEEIRDPVTGGTEVIKLEKKSYTASSAFDTYKSVDGHIFRSTKKTKGVKFTNSQ